MLRTQLSHPPFLISRHLSRQDCSSFLDYCTNHTYENYARLPLGDKGELVPSCINNTIDNANQTITQVINEYSISPAEDYFNGFCLGLYVEGTHDGTTHDLGTIHIRCLQQFLIFGPRFPCH